jgi:pimeloyl-ACP methyl ester carboxylesterase
MTSPASFIPGNVISADGTGIGYRQMGKGPGLLLVHGGLMTAQNFMELGKFLSTDYTVYIPDRRGRGASGPHGASYNLARETEDMEAIIRQTGARFMFGLSSGAIITLSTALRTSLLEKIALYEPPIPVKGADPTAWLPEYEKALRSGNYGAALISIIRGTGNTFFFSALPKFLLAPLFNRVLKLEHRKTAPPNVSLYDLIPTMQYDAQFVRTSGDLVEKCRDVRVEVLLLGGQKSKAYLRRILDVLEKKLPNVKRVTFPRVGHIAADNDGKPGLVARELAAFFGK